MSKIQDLHDYIATKINKPLDPNHNHNMAYPTIMYTFDCTDFSDHNQQIVLEDYDIQTNLKSLGGRAVKQFFIASSHAFDELFDHNRNKSYVTYIDKVINEGYKAQHISVLQKKTSPIRALNEVFASKTLNYFGIPTVYNIAAKSYGATSGYYVLSTDFVRPGEEVHRFNEYSGSMNDINSWLNGIDYFVDKYQLTKNILGLKHPVKEINDSREKLKRQFVKSYLYRQVLLADIDYAPRNAGVVYTDKGIELLPNYDLECTLTKKYYTKENDLLDCYLLYPDIVQEFVDEVNMANAIGSNGKSAFRQLLEQTTDNIDFRIKAGNVITHNVDQINRIMKYIQNSNTNNMES